MAAIAKIGRVLVWEQNKEVLRRIRRVIRRDCEMFELDSYEALDDAIESFDPDVLLVDGDSGGAATLKLLRKIRQLDSVRGSFTGLILMISSGDSPHIQKASEAGADSFCMKAFIGAQLPAVLKSVFRLRNMTDKLRNYTDKLLANNLELETLVITDELTGLFNMRFVKKRLVEEFNLAIEKGQPISILMIDIDHFKKVNDGHDHLLGSYVIGALGREIFSVTRRSDIPGRYGGDEFIVVLPYTNSEGAKSVAQRLHDRIISRVYSNGVDATKITISQGIATLELADPDIKTPEDLLRRADKALYTAKESGRNAIRIYSQGAVRRRKKAG